MNATELDRAAKMFERLKELDAKVVKLDRLAMKLSDGVHYVTLSVTPHYKSKSKEVATIRSSPYEGLFSQYAWIYPSILDPKKKEPEADPNEFDLRDVDALACLGVIISSVNEERSAIIESLQGMGLKIA